MNKQEQDIEMRWYHYVIGMGAFMMVPLADPIVEGILWLVGVK